MGLGGRRHASIALPPGKTRYPFYRRLGGPQGWFLRKYRPNPGFELQTIQPLVSRFTAYIISARSIIIMYVIINVIIFALPLFRIEVVKPDSW